MQRATPHPAFGHLPQQAGEGESATSEMCEYSRREAGEGDHAQHGGGGDRKQITHKRPGGVTTIPFDDGYLFGLPPTRVAASDPAATAPFSAASISAP